jgi:hypothetical protein
MHRREEAQSPQALIDQRVPCPRRGAGCRGVEHEESDDPGRMPRGRSGDRGLVARDAGDQGRALYAAGIELLDPAVGERFRCARIVPLKFAVQIVQADLKVRLYVRGFIRRRGRLTEAVVIGAVEADLCGVPAAHACAVGCKIRLLPGQRAEKGG